MEFEIFRTGTHTSNNGVTKSYSLSDLNAIVDSYNPANLEAPIVVGHPKSNSPAFGWIEALKVVGDRLIAKAKDVVPEFLDTVKKGLFKKRSIALDKDGKLIHVGFLGATIPAVQGLADIQFSDENSNELFEFTNEDFTQSPSNESFLPGQIISELSSLSKQINILTDYFDKFSKPEESPEQQTLVNNFSIKLDADSYQKQLDDKISNGSLTPPMKEKFLNIISFFNTSNYSALDPDTFSSSFSSLLNEFINSIPNIISFEDFAQKPTSADIQDHSFDGLSLDPTSYKLHKKALSLSAQENISYIQSIKELTTKE